MTEANEWDLLDTQKFENEETVLARFLALAPLANPLRDAVVHDAALLVERTRARTKRSGVVESFLQEFSLSTPEGLALMCLAEALLRTPDERTRDLLIAEKIGMADWASHLGQSDSLFVNASTWGLMLTGRLMDIDQTTRRDVPGFLKRLSSRIGEPVIRQAVAAAMRIMGEQFVLGRSITDALDRARREGLTCSFDMLGEGARTPDDAENYARLYADAIGAVGTAAAGLGPERGHGISVKLSALSPRYEAIQETRVWEELYPRLKLLAIEAARYDINLTIDAEEADRLVLSLKLIDRLAQEPELGEWVGLGLAVQAYQKRGLAVIEALAGLARRSERRLMVRLVKGAYWDSEIKAAQSGGMPGYPVFTTKPATDLSYLVCARALIAAAPALYPQFATHNAHTLAAIRHMAKEAGTQVEYQRLHGMGETLHDVAEKHYGPAPLRIYAPVGGHEQLLPYLVRRLLENGANSSFVHALLDKDIPAAQTVPDPIAQVEAAPDRHPRIPLPCDLYVPDRLNSAGRDLSQTAERARMAARAAEAADRDWQSAPIIDGHAISASPALPVIAPADIARTIGTVIQAETAHIDIAAAAARHAQPDWDRAGGAHRGAILRRMADALDQDAETLCSLLTVEAGKTFADSIGEVREAVDFCRYYANLAERHFQPTPLRGPVGETNSWQVFGRGIFACISPWNFPLSIFTGQIAAALAAGNAVIAKPAEQTPLIAAHAVRLFHGVGLDPALLALLPGNGETLGAALVAHPAVDGVAFTGGTDTAWAINRAIAGRDGPIIPFIAETGGLNAMFVDTTALREQVIDDVLISAFGSAGQRCSALRMLFLPEESADEILAGLAGALSTRTVGDPARPETDIGPIIDGEALRHLRRHVDRLEREARIVARHPGSAQPGHFFGPIIAEVQQPDFLEREVFGPILHVCRYAARDLPEYASRLAARGYGLTLGIHSRLEHFAREIQALVPAGNIYINRSMIGAVVGVQPFGGLGLSGTGPKAGGPHALTRYCNERSISVNIMAQGGDPTLLSL